MKVHIGVDAGTGCVHTVTATAANVHDVDEVPNLIREDDEVMYGDSGYLGVENRKEIAEDEHLSSIDYRIAKRPSSLKTTNAFQGFFADAENGDILYATDPSFVGGNIAEFGLAPDTLRNGYMDFALINGVRCYVVTSKVNDCVIYSLTDTGVLFRHSLSYGLLASASISPCSAISCRAGGCAASTFSASARPRSC